MKDIIISDVPENMIQDCLGGNIGIKGIADPDCCTNISIDCHKKEITLSLKEETPDNIIILIREVLEKTLRAQEGKLEIEFEITENEFPFLSHQEFKGLPFPVASDSFDHMRKKMCIVLHYLIDNPEKYIKIESLKEEGRERCKKAKDKEKMTRLKKSCINQGSVVPNFNYEQLKKLAELSEEEAKNVVAVLNGMKLIKTEFEKALNVLGVDTINAVGETFNPEFHEAVAREPSDIYEKDVVVKQWRAGYKLGDRLIRPATVVVSTGSDTGTEEVK